MILRRRALTLTAVRTQLSIEDLAPGGEGVGRSGARTVFVPWTAPGDRIVADVPLGEGTAHGTLVALEAPGAGRVAPPCPHFGPGGPARSDADYECGGCEWLHVGYAAQLEAKERTVRESLRRIARLEPGGYEARAIVGSPAPLRYRARAKFHFDRASGRLVYFRRRSHAPVRLRECHLLDERLDALRGVVGPALAESGSRPARSRSSGPPSRRAARRGSSSRRLRPRCVPEPRR